MTDEELKEWNIKINQRVQPWNPDKEVLERGRKYREERMAEWDALILKTEAWQN